MLKRITRSGLVWILPCLLTAVLISPCISFTYLWDDYAFLRNALAFRLNDIVPTQADAFYRPVSRGLYFTLLSSSGSHGSLIGHLLNAGFLILIVSLLFRLVELIANRRVALYACLAFSCTGAIPLLVGWVSGCQDLLAMVFVLAALNLQLRGRHLLALGATALGLLSKETALTVIPALAFCDRIVGQKAKRSWATPASYGLLVGLWALIHPGVHALLHRSLRSGATGYVGLEDPGRWPGYFVKYTLTMLNVPLRSIVSPWWPDYLLPLALGLVLLVAAVLAARYIGESAPESFSRKRIAVFALLLAIPPLLLNSLMVRVWAPYYTAFPALGASLLLGLIAERLPARALPAAFAGYLLLGFWCRTSRFDPSKPEESNLRVTSATLQTIERNFLRVRPSFQPTSTALVSVQRSGAASVYTHLYYLQALSVWYRDPTLQTMRPDWRPPPRNPEHLFWIGKDLNVHEIDLDTMRPRSSGTAIEYAEYQKTVRYYARGLAASGDLDRAVRMLLLMPEPNQVSWTLDRRMAAMLLIAGGRERAATDLLSALPPFQPDTALDLVAALLADTPPHVDWDRAALRAFGLEPNDPAPWRSLMRKYVVLDRLPEAAHFASELLQLDPADSEATRVVERSRFRTPRAYDRPVPPDPAN